MNHPMIRTASTALARAGGAAMNLKDDVRQGVARWVPGAMKAIGTGAQIAVLRDGSRKVARIVKRNPVTTTAVIAAAAGASVALWLMRRNKQRRGLDEKLHASEAKPERVLRASKRTRAPRKKAAKSAHVEG